ncbi:MAG: flagellar hook-associated protein 2 [Gammaproteobacteria bacterium]|nr:MAG: flagellar hook-associated protein 2 [Gammaproteobacteria bacterium]
MAGISSLGVGSGLDLNSLVTSLVRAERSPTESRLNRSQAAAETQLSALGRLRSAVGELETRIGGLSNFDVSRSASSSAANKVQVTAEGNPDLGSFSVRVSALASAQSLATSAFADVDQDLGSGSLLIEQGGESVTLEFSPERATLADVRDAINASDLDVQAVIVRDGDSSRLLLTSTATGSAGEMTLSVTGGLDARLASSEMTETAAAANASFSVNGLELSSSSNQVEDVIPGLTLNLRQTTEGNETVTVTVAQDRAGAGNKLEAMVKAYNGLVDTMKSLGRVDPEGGKSGPLVGDATLRALQGRLGGAFTTPQAVEPGQPTMMLDLGLSVDVEGRASLNASTLDEALMADEAGVEALVSAFATRFSAVIEGFAGSGGVIASRTDGLTAQLRRVADQRASLDLRMEQVETRLRTQFSALDATLAQFQNTSEFLGQQLAGLADLNRR